MMHFKTGRRKRSEFQFIIGDNILELTEKYKYLGVIFTEKNDLSRFVTKPTKWHVCPAKTQISLGIHPV